MLGSCFSGSGLLTVFLDKDEDITHTKDANVKDLRRRLIGFFFGVLGSLCVVIATGCVQVSTTHEHSATNMGEAPLR